jgi:hypothetical protein
VSSPININQSVLQSVISERVQQVQQQHPDMQQRYFEHQLTQDRIKKQHKVDDFEEMDYIQLRDKEERKQRKDQQKGMDDEKPTPETETAGSTDQPARIDIKA